MRVDELSMNAGSDGYFRLQKKLSPLSFTLVSLSLSLFFSLVLFRRLSNGQTRRKPGKRAATATAVTTAAAAAATGRAAARRWR